MNKQHSLAQKKAFSVFQKVALDCEAYSRFLGERNFNYKKVSASQFEEIPISDKKTYLKKHTLEKRIYKNKELSDFYMLSISSGTTGEPTIWPRHIKRDAYLETLQTDFLNEHFGVKKKKTLIVVAFGMGATTAGMLTSKLAWEGSRHGPMSVITPGVDPETTIFLIQRLYRQFDQVVCIGYPPFISGFVDLAIKKRHPVKKWNLKICFTSESVSAVWRNEMARKTSIKGETENIVAFYGTTEAGIIGVETRETHSIIKHCLNDEAIRVALFNTQSLPTLVEVDMMKKFVEIVGGEVVITVDQPVPLIRYNLHDRGLFIAAKLVRELLAKTGIIYRPKEPDKLFLAVFGKKEASRGEPVFYIEDIRYALEQVSCRHKLTGFFQYKEGRRSGKFVLQLRVYLKENQKLTRNEQNKFKKEVEELLKRVKKTQKLTFDVSFGLLVSFVSEDAKIKYKKGKLQYYL